MDDQRDTTDRFLPRFDAAGLVTAIVTDADTHVLLMVAHMNEEAIAKTRETSGNGLTLVEMRVDCDQDALLLRVRPAGPACHTGRRSCFYRRIEADGSLTFLVDDAQG